MPVGRGKVGGLAPRKNLFLAVYGEAHLAREDYEHAFGVRMHVHTRHGLRLVLHDHRVTALGRRGALVHEMYAMLFLIGNVDDRLLFALSHFESAFKSSVRVSLAGRRRDDTEQLRV